MKFASLSAVLRNRISLLGSAVVQVTVVLLVTLVAIELLGAEGHPYIGLITYMVLPGFLVFGLVLIVWGIRRQRKRVPGVEFPIVNFNQAHVRKQLMILLLMVTVGVVFLAAGSFSAVHYMESNEFCGQVCHSVMTPEYTAHARSSHARVRCVECHVGSGADWFVKSKLSGAWQLVSVTLDLYDRPISTPVHNLRPSKGTCENCHWSDKFHGAPPKMITRFADDEANTETKTILIMNVGGHDFAESRGIHWHMDRDVQLRYRSDPLRETIHEVELTRGDGSVTRYASQSNEAPAEGETEWRTMDCIDCHNRPTHVFYAPDEAIDLALERGFIARDLPFVKREGMRAIQAGYDSHDAATAGISSAIDAFYRSEYPDLADARRAEIETAGGVLGRLYVANVFPSMSLDWNTYPNHVGHERSPGCFRCHSGDHATEEGETISFDCRPCHMIVAWDEASPEILELLKE